MGIFYLKEALEILQLVEEGVIVRMTWGRGCEEEQSSTEHM